MRDEKRPCPEVEQFLPECKCPQDPLKVADRCVLLFVLTNWCAARKAGSDKPRKVLADLTITPRALTATPDSSVFFSAT